MKTINVKFDELCIEIDYYKEEAKFWKSKYDELNKEYSLHINESLLSAQKGVANALRFVLSVTDDENGNLVIPAENRKTLLEGLAD